MSTIELTGIAKTYREIQAEIKSLEEEADTLKQQMIQEMDARQTDVVNAGEYTIRYTLVESSRVDTAAMKAAGIYENFIRNTTSTRFQVA